VLKEGSTEGYRFMGSLFSALAVILLLIATILNPRENQWGAILFILGDFLLVLGIIIIVQKRRK
jgi:hypothetical protein